MDILSARKHGMNEICIGDTVYAITASYLAGVRAARGNVPYHANPHRSGSQPYFDWNSGYENEDEGHHADLSIPGPARTLFQISAIAASRQLAILRKVAMERSEVKHDQMESAPNPPILSD